MKKGTAWSIGAAALGVAVVATVYFADISIELPRKASARRDWGLSINNASATIAVDRRHGVVCYGDNSGSLVNAISCVKVWEPTVDINDNPIAPK